LVRKSRVAFTRLLMSSAYARLSLRKIELMCFSTARLVRTSVSAMAALLLPLGDLGEDLALASGERGQGRALDAHLGGHERLDDLRVQHGAASGHGLDRRDQLGAVVDAFLEQVGPALGSGLQEVQGVHGLGVVAEHHHPDLGVLLAQQRREADALVGARGRHPDVGDHHIGALALDRLQQ
jgi:hypothetical protein